jgi:hypothetical protein
MSPFGHKADMPVVSLDVRFRGQIGKQLLGLSFTAEPEAPGSLNRKTTRSRRAIVPSTHLAREGRMTVTIGRRELLVALGGIDARIGPMPKNVSKHGPEPPSSCEPVNAPGDRPLP